MTDDEKKITPAEMKELTDEQTGDAAGGVSASERREKAKKKAKKMEQAKHISKIISAVSDAGVKVGSSFIEQSAVLLGEAKKEDE